ncbi:hypothetical protein KFL_000330160 [Klebsormidium nitens]|uniref:Uncharacterized protein n=1 Tax=Klebsormidium nitens TaxID=105231 RepID=A0A1Y1HLS1_KLENI|nr:hypothetical protein KFL_000330160 [Klebsormidium nitens]|eukprot:GAQ79570.1 hypothetical protein KFL_000330160 [Klebsormidium nitens]
MAFNASTPGRSSPRDLTDSGSLFREFDPTAFSRSIKSDRSPWAATSSSRGARAWAPQYLPADPPTREGGSREVGARDPSRPERPPYVPSKPSARPPPTSARDFSSAPTRGGPTLDHAPRMHLTRLLAASGARGLEVVTRMAKLGKSGSQKETNDLYKGLAAIGGLDAVHAAASLLGDDVNLARVNGTTGPRATRGLISPLAAAFGLNTQADFDALTQGLAQLGGVALVADVAAAEPEMQAVDENLHDLENAIGADLGLPPQTRGSRAGLPDDVTATLQQAGLGALSDGISWASGGKASVDRVLATVGPAGAEIVRFLAEERGAVRDAAKNEALAQIAALGGVEGLHAAAVATGDRGLFGDIFGGIANGAMFWCLLLSSRLVLSHRAFLRRFAGLFGDIFGGIANVGMGILQGGMGGGLPGALMGGAGAGLNLVGSLIGNRDIEAKAAESNVVLANLVAVAGPRGIPLVAELQRTTDDAKIGLAYQARLLRPLKNYLQSFRLAYLAGDDAPSALAAAAQLSGDRGLLDMLKTAAGKAGSWAAKTGTALAKDAAKQAIHGALDAFNSGATWQDSLQAGFDRVKNESTIGKAGSAAAGFLGGGSRSVERSRSAPDTGSGSDSDLTEDQRSALQQLENHPEINPLLLKQAHLLATSSESELLPGTRSMIQGALIGKLGMAAGEPIVEALENRTYLGNDDDATEKVSRAISGGIARARSLAGTAGTMTFGG